MVIINQKSTKIETDMKIKINVLQNRQVSIGTIHDYSESYEVEGNVSFQHVRRRLLMKEYSQELYKNFYAKSSFTKQASVEGPTTCSCSCSGSGP